MVQLARMEPDSFLYSFSFSSKNEVLADLCVFKPKDGIEGGIGFFMLPIAKHPGIILPYLNTAHTSIS